jgi:hypothetical protein
MEQTRNLPNTNQLSVLAAAILLVYALSPLISITPVKWEFTVSGVFFALEFNISVLVSLLTAGMAAVGTRWILCSHPKHETSTLLLHQILPALTAWVINIPLGNMTIGLRWWAIFSFGGALLVLVFVAEYIVIDQADANHALAAVGLTAVSFSLFLFLAMAIKGAGLRLYLELPLLGITTFMISLRTLYLRIGRQWHIGWAVVIALIVIQLDSALHYLPLSPSIYGLLILAPAYTLTSIATTIEEDRPLITVWVEPVIIITLIILIIIFMP